MPTYSFTFNEKLAQLVAQIVHQVIQALALAVTRDILLYQLIAVQIQRLNYKAQLVKSTAAQDIIQLIIFVNVNYS